MPGSPGLKDSCPKELLRSEGGDPEPDSARPFVGGLAVATAVARSNTRSSTRSVNPRHLSASLSDAGSGRGRRVRLGCRVGGRACEGSPSRCSRKVEFRRVSGWPRGCHGRFRGRSAAARTRMTASWIAPARGRIWLCDWISGPGLISSTRGEQVRVAEPLAVQTCPVFFHTPDSWEPE